MVGVIVKSGTGALSVSNSVIANTSGDGLRIAAGYSSFEHSTTGM